MSGFSSSGSDGTKGFQVRHVRDARVVETPCGTSRRVFSRDDTPVASLHVVEITDSRKHYHENATEYYFVLEGSGKMELNAESIDLEPGTAVIIDPLTAHRAEGNIKALIVAIPAWKEGDEYLHTSP